MGNAEANPAVNRTRHYLYNCNLIDKDVEFWYSQDTKPSGQRRTRGAGRGGGLVFQVGDKVVYPMHGAGVIEAIEEQEVLGKRKQYYVLRLPVNEMKVMVPCESSSHAGLRAIISEQTLQKVLDVLTASKSLMTKSWNHRYRENLEKIKSGDILELAEVVRNLHHHDREKGLSTGERKMLESARQILLSEIIVAKDLDIDQASRFLEQVLAR
jgi:CarD family transcriptional regulator